MGGAPMGGDPYAGVQKRRGYASWAVMWHLGRKTHSLVVFAALGASAVLQSIVVLGAPFIKQVYFVSGVLLSEQTSGGNVWAPVLNGVREISLVGLGQPVAAIRIGWLGSCIYDYGLSLSTCDFAPAYPLTISNFSLPEARGIENVISSGSARVLAINAGAAALTCIATGTHRLLRLRGPFFVSCAAAVLTWIAFIADCSIYDGAAQNIDTDTANLVGSPGPAFMLEGIAAGLVVVGTWASYSRCVKAELGWPIRDPNPPAAADFGGGMAPGGDPMGMGAPPMGGMPPVGGDPFGAPGGMPPMGPPGM